MRAAGTRVAVGGLALTLAGILATVQPVTVDRIAEDDPRWDCATMGNRVCGTDR